MGLPCCNSEKIDIKTIRGRNNGKNNKIIKLIKFVTMKKNSPNMGAGDITLKRDPRVLPFGKILRKTKLNEVPQLFNVLKGEMSLVGPRPLFKEDTAYFNENYMRRLNVLPGLTGLLQINERNTSEFEVWYKYDIEYINSWSLYLDIKILLKTPLSLFKNSSKGL